MPFIVYLVTGMVPWFFFSDSLLSATNVFREYSYLVKKSCLMYKFYQHLKFYRTCTPNLFFILIGFVITTANGYYPSLYSLQLIYYLACLLVF